MSYVKSCVFFAILFTTSCSSSCENFFGERPDYSLCPSTKGSDWKTHDDEFLRFTRTLPTKSSGCLVYNADVSLDVISTNVRGTICNACDSAKELSLAMFRGTPLLQSTFRIEDDYYGTCLSSGGEQVHLVIDPMFQSVETGETITASGTFLYRGGFRAFTDHSIARGNDFQIFWPAIGSGEIVLEQLEDGCLGTFELNDSLYVEVVDEPFSEPARNFLEDKILRRE